MLSNCRRKKRRGQKSENFRMSVLGEGKGKEGDGERKARENWEQSKNHQENIWKTDCLFMTCSNLPPCYLLICYFTLSLMLFSFDLI